MKKFFIIFALLTSLTTLVATEAQARRFGGMSFGRQSLNVNRMPSQPMQRQASPQQPQQSQTQQQQRQQPMQNPAQPRSRFGGMLGGALLGLGLGALLAHFGIVGDSANLISTILLFTLIYFAIRFFMRRRNPPTTYPQEPDVNQRESIAPEIGSGTSTPTQNLMDPPPLTWSIPDDFEMESFIRNAKSYYIQLQAAWDKANIDALYELTTPEMYAEIKLQLQDRGPSPNITDVVSIDAELLGIEQFGDEYLASVRYTGTVRENQSAELVHFTEVWNLTRPLKGKQGWLLAGVQQIA